MSWIALQEIAQLDTLHAQSFLRPQLIFKHSTRCSISGVAHTRLEKALPEIAPHADCYYLDLLNYRAVSNAVAERFSVFHESPQVLIIRNGECTYEESHLQIQPAEIVKQILPTPV